MATTIIVRPLIKADIPSAIECVQQAFVDDPFFLWSFDMTKTHANSPLVGLSRGRRSGADWLAMAYSYLGPPLSSSYKAVASWSVRSGQRALYLWGLHCGLYYVAVEVPVKEEERRVSATSVEGTVHFEYPPSSTSHSSTIALVGGKTDSSPKATRKETAISANSSSCSTFATVDGNIVGVAAWHAPQPPAAPLPLRERLADAQLWLRQLLTNLRFRGRGGLRVSRYQIWKAQQAIATARHTGIEAGLAYARGVYHCHVLAVAPEQQGKGVGRRLMDAVAAKMADSEGLACYLESSKGEPNVAIYRRFGFEVVEELVCEEGGESCTVSLAHVVKPAVLA